MCDYWHLQNFRSWSQSWFIWQNVLRFLFWLEVDIVLQPNTQVLYGMWVMMIDFFVLLVVCVGSGSGMTTILFLKDIGPVGQNRVNVQFILLGEGLHKILNTRHPLQRWLMKLAQFYCSFGENSVTPLNEVILFISTIAWCHIITTVMLFWRNLPKLQLRRQTCVRLFWFLIPITPR